ncbi:MAG: hypothetical protein RLZZ440_1707, partial [Planctomycetota bacterium]
MRFLPDSPGRESGGQMIFLPIKR